MADPLTMFIVIRKDLIKRWQASDIPTFSANPCFLADPIDLTYSPLHACILNVPSVIAQACHASTAVLHTTQELRDTREYLADIHNMHKVVLQVKNQPQLEELAASLSTLEVPHVVWREQPEDILTCLSTSPIRRSAEVKEAFKKCSLFR
ncbi:MAG: hypothetical protein J3Q66DRAFT_399403 [Benniella sp.]|nr:MAG: hypothetical protein J3Q66DRAFT_399403 [Benniella sp.]